MAPFASRVAGAAVLIAGTAAVASASSHVVAFSSSTHFACDDVGATLHRGICAGAAEAVLPPRAASDLLHFLSSSEFSSTETSLPAVASRLAVPDQTPEMVLAVSDSNGVSAGTVLEDLSNAVGASSSVKTPSSFSSTLVGEPIPVVADHKVTVDDLARMASEGNGALANGKVDTFSIDVTSAGERASVLSAVRSLVDGANGRFAVVWTSSRVDDESHEEIKEAHDSAVKGGAAGEAAAAAAEAAVGPKEVDETDSKANATTFAATGFNADGTLVKNTSMDPPLITVGALVGLLVSATLLLILGPGLMCLYNIEAQERFDYSKDRDEAKKKMQ